VELMPRGEFDRSARRAQTRARLLEAAAEVYARRGFAGATLEEVASEAGFTKGAVYGHFGSKENLLLALVEEHFAVQVAEQMALFDRDRATWERPLAGSERSMEQLREHPDRFRLFVELWVYAQRDEALRERLADGLAMLRATFARFAAESSADAGFDVPEGVPEQFANIMLGLGVGLSMLKLSEPEAVPSELLGTTLSVLIRATESSAHAQHAFSELARVAARGAAGGEQTPAVGRRRASAARTTP
jgi:AcrR family transcriptional regulator